MQYSRITVGENLAEALRYVSHGYKVYPVWGVKDGKCLCGGLKGCRPGKHPWGRVVPHGEKDATTDKALVRQWFKGAAVNVGISVSGFYVVDFDPKNGGMETLTEWEQKHGNMPTTPTVRSGSGGQHYYFLPVEEKHNPKPGKGVDFLVGGGVIAPPSLHPSGNRYEWIVPPETPLARLPGWLEALCVQPDDKVLVEQPFDPMQGKVAAGETFADLGMFPKGCRNDAVKRTIGSMLAHGFTPEQVLEEGLRWAERQEPPYSENHLREKVRFFAAKQKQRVEIVELKFPQAAPLHTGCASQFASSQDGCLEWSSPRKMESRLRVFRVVRPLELGRG
jgi:hypothetical protein